MAEGCVHGVQVFRMGDSTGQHKDTGTERHGGTGPMRALARTGSGLAILDLLQYSIL